MTDGYGSTRATTTWISSDGTKTNHDPDTEMGFWVRLFHNECDRSAYLEQEVERLREELVQANNAIKLLIAIETSGKDS